MKRYYNPETKSIMTSADLREEWSFFITSENLTKKSFPFSRYESERLNGFPFELKIIRNEVTK